MKAGAQTPVEPAGPSWRRWVASILMVLSLWSMISITVLLSTMLGDATAPSPPATMAMAVSLLPLAALGAVAGYGFAIWRLFRRQSAFLPWMAGLVFHSAFLLLQRYGMQYPSVATDVFMAVMLLKNLIPGALIWWDGRGIHAQQTRDQR